MWFIFGTSRRVSDVQACLRLAVLFYILKDTFVTKNGTVPLSVNELHLILVFVSVKKLFKFYLIQNKAAVRVFDCCLSLFPPLLPLSFCTIFHFLPSLLASHQIHFVVPSSQLPRSLRLYEFRISVLQVATLDNYDYPLSANNIIGQYCDL